MSIISTSATHDCSGYSAPPDTWNQLRAADRLQIPQPNTVLETTDMPWPHILSISHKLRVVIRFDQTLSKERDLQLSFPITIHPTLDEDGSPVHPDIRYRPHARRRRRAGHALYGIDTRQSGEDGVSDDEVPLPMYENREDTLLLMVGQEAHETSLEDESDAHGISVVIGYPDGTIPNSPSEASLSSLPRSPNSPNGPFPFPFPPVLTPIQGEQHAWASAGRRTSLIPESSATLVSLSSAPRRHSAIEQPYERILPPPYVMSSPTEEPPGSTLSYSDTPRSDISEHLGRLDEEIVSGVSSTSRTTAETLDRAMDHDMELEERTVNTRGKSRARNVADAISVQIAPSSSSSSSYNRSGFSSHVNAESSRSMPCPLPSPPYEIQEETLSYPEAGRHVCTRSTISSSRSPSSSSLEASGFSGFPPLSPDPRDQDNEA